jgi:hypothetical protein
MCAFGIFFWDAEVEAWLLGVIVSRGVRKVSEFGDVSLM